MRTKFSKGDRVIAGGMEGLVWEVFDGINPNGPSYVNLYTVRHMCRGDMGPWDHFHRSYEEGHLRTAPYWLRLWRSISPGNLTMHDYNDRS